MFMLHWTKSERRAYSMLCDATVYFIKLTVEKVKFIRHHQWFHMRMTHTHTHNKLDLFDSLVEICFFFIIIHVLASCKWTQRNEKKKLFHTINYVWRNALVIVVVEEYRLLHFACDRIYIQRNKFLVITLTKKPWRRNK